MDPINRADQSGNACPGGARGVGGALWCYSAAAGLAGLAVLLRWWLVPVFDLTTPYLTVYPVVMVVAMRWGVGPGLLATAVSVVATETWFVPPLGTLPNDATFLGRAVFFFVSSAYLGRVGARMRRAEALARAEAGAAGEARRKLGDSEERFRALLTATSEVVYRVNPDWTEMRQLRGREFVPDTDSPSRTWLDRYVFRADQPLVLAAIREAVRTGGMYGLEHRVLRMDGSVGWTHSRAVPLRGSDGAIVEWVGAATDITARKRMEEELRALNDDLDRRVHERTTALIRSQTALDESRRRLRMALSAAGMGSMEYRPATDEVSGDEQAARLLGLEAESFRRAYDEVLALVHPDDRDRIDATFRGALATREMSESEGRILPADGQARVLKVRGGPQFDPAGKVVRMTGVCWDITETRRMEEALRQSERLATLGQAAAVLSHESRNAVQNCQAALEMLHRVMCRSDKVGYVEIALRSLDSLRRAYEDVREYAAPLRLDLDETEINEVWRAVWDDLAPKRAGRQARFVEHCNGSDFRLRADVFRLRQVFRNLIENALDAAPDPVEITVSCAEAPWQGRPGLRVTVRDNGPGLGDADPALIFEPFYTRKSKGTGLGLAIVKRILEAHGGRIEALSRPGQGLELIAHLPREPYTGPSPTPPPAAP